jgi:integrase
MTVKRVKLTQASIAGLKKEAVRLGKDDVTFWDEEDRGFGLRVRKSGNATWIYQYQRGTTQGKIRIGDANAIPAAVARQRAKDERANVQLGRDPGAAKAEERRKEKDTLRSIVDRYLTAKENELRPESLREARRFLLQTFASLHKVPVHKIRKRDVAEIIIAISTTPNERTGEPKRATAAAALSHLNTALNWAVGVDLVESNPAATINGPKRGARKRVLKDHELRRVWLACDDNSDPSRITRLLILTGQRRDEISGMHEEELDRAKGSWTLPEGRSKNKRAHTLRLPELAWGIIGQREGAGALFGRSENGYRGWQSFKKRLDQRCGVAAWVIHDLRRSVATGMAEIGIRPHIIEACLNHVSGHKGGIAGVYNLAEYETDVRNALAQWADHIASITQDTERKIIPMREKPIPA